MDGVRTEEPGAVELEVRSIGAGLVGGLLAGLAMGVVLQFGTDLLPFLGAFLGETSVVRGWFVHLVVSLLYGVLLAVVLAYSPVRSFVAGFGTFEFVLVGITYATTIAAVSISILPFVFDLPWVTLATEAPFPSLLGPEPGGLLQAMFFAVGHLVYGAVLGAAYALLGPRPE